jgi:flagellar hook-associated protein 2
MSSPISFSGFNGVDFSLILNSIMTQESAPLTALQARQTAVATRIANFATLATKTSALETAADALSSASSLAGFSAASTDSTAVAVSAGSGASAGHYDIIVNELARAQVKASTSFAASSTAAFVTTDGPLAITATGSVTPVNVDLTAGMTMAQVADAINAKTDAAATASVVQDGTASFRLVLTAKATGVANGFTIANTPSGDVAFGINAVDATDASLKVNNIDITSASNTLDAAIPGASITMLKKSATTTVGVDIATDPSALKSKVSGFIFAYNELVRFVATQTTAANGGDDSSIARDPLVRQLRNSLRTVLTSSYGAGGTNNLSQIGVEFDRTGGTLSLKAAAFDAALKSGGASSVSTLFAGTTGAPGVFASVSSLLDSYTQSSGTFSAVKAQLTAQVTNMSDQIDRMQSRLALRRAALQKEFTAADQAMSALKNQSSSLTGFTSSLTSQ